jgi:signal transduction histidine kinase
VVVAGAIANVIAVALVARSNVLTHPQANATARGLFVALVLAVGTYTWWRRPDSASGLLLIAVGLSYSLTSLMALDEPLAFTLGRVALAAFVVLAAYVFVCFPRDHLGAGRDRRFIYALVLSSVVTWVPALAVGGELPVGGPVAQCRSECPHNALQLVTVSSTVSDALAYAVTAITALAVVGVALALVGKARAPDQRRRRAVVPLLWLMSAIALSYGVYTVLREAGVAGTDVPAAIIIGGLLLMPLAMLAGQVRGRVFAATSLGGLLASVGGEPVTPRRVERLISGALEDPTLRLALWAPELGVYTDARGAPLELPLGDRDRAVTPIARDDQPWAAVIHDPGLDQGPEVVAGLAATALVLLERTRLADELSASRSRLVEAAHHERLRLERDLHDGAQQRLVSIQIKLSLLRDVGGAEERRALLDELEGDADAALAELRAVAHGLYPPLLRERGLADALTALVGGLPVAARVVDDGIGRYAPPTEAAIYYSALEALQNAMKHAGDDAEITVTLEHSDGTVSFSVEDNGVGFDTRTASSELGLISLRDRMGAVGGTLRMASTPGKGTIVSGTAPARQRRPDFDG